MTEIQHKTKKTFFDQEIPNLVELQITSYDWFLKEGLKELLDSFSPIVSYDGSTILEFIGDPIYEDPENTEDDCRRELSTYEGKVKVKVQLSRTDDKGNPVVSKEDLYLAKLPKMTDNGTFFINGAERVVISQLSRSPGAYFEDNFDLSGKQLYTGKILPSIGAWLEMFTDNNEMKGHIASGTKFPITLLLRAFNKIDETCPYAVDRLLGKTFNDVIPADDAEEAKMKSDGYFAFKDQAGNTVLKLLAGKKKKVSETETTVIEEQHINLLKEKFGDYIYTTKFESLSTTKDLFEIFGRKEFIQISRLFQITNYTKVADKINKVENVLVSIPALDSNSKLNDKLRVLDFDILNSEGKVLFKKGTKFDDEKLMVSLPVKEEGINIGKKTLSRLDCIDYLTVKGMNDKYAEAIKDVECEKVNILTEWLVKQQILNDPSQKNPKPLYNITGLCAVNDIINEETGEIICGATEIIKENVADYLYNSGNNVYLEYYNVSELISNTLNNEDPKSEPGTGTKKLEHVADDTTAIMALYRYLRPKDPVSVSAGITYIKNYFVDNKRYDLGKVGRYKINRKLGLTLPDNSQTINGNKCKTRSITRDDLIKFIKYTIYLSKDGKIITDFYPEKRQLIIDKVNEYISLVKKGKIDGVDKIDITESFEQSDSPKDSNIKVTVSKSKYSKSEDIFLDGRNAMYERFIEILSQAEKGYLLTKEEYIRLNAFLGAVSEDMGEELPFVKYALSDSPQNLKKDYVLMRVTPCITDEIDHLENKRVRSVGELLQEQLRIGFIRMEKNAKDKMNTNSTDKMSASTLISNKPIDGALRGFFGQSQLSQFMDQTNPLAELTHKRRLSSLGPGGLQRQSAKIEVRDVNHSFYGRICPIETPEGPNIGLIVSMAIHAKINEYGFLETPYREVKDGHITDNIKFLSAEEESHEYIATARIAYDEDTKEITEKNTVVRHNGKYPRVDCKKITLMEISPNQIMSVAANLIPFIENDDANRALMGSNMQRQAVPLLKPTAPIVRTGIEGRAAHDSGVEKFAKRAGKVVWVSCENIVVLPEEPDYIDRYEISFTKKKKYDKRDNLFVCTKKRYAFDDKEKKNLISEEVIPVSSIITREGKTSDITIDEVKYLCVDPDSEIEKIIPFDENIKKNDLVFDGKVYRGKSKTYSDAGFECKGFNGIITGIEKFIEEDEDEEQTEKLRLTVSELDLYCLEPTLARNAFPSDYAVIRFGKIEIKANTAGVGCGNNNKIVIESPDENQWAFDVTVCDVSRLINMIRSNQGTCINSRAVVEIGRRVYKDELLADGACTDHGELALGQNVTVAFLPWNGYNYEDAILLNEKLVKDDKFSSVHIEKYEIEARDTKLGPEEITRDIPNVGEDKLGDLDERGIIKIGATVTAESILVGKIAPKGAKEPDPEDKLIRSIFGNKAEETRDVSLKVPHGESGTIVDVKVFSKNKYQCSNPDCASIISSCKKLSDSEMVCEHCGAELKVLEGDDGLSAGVNQLVRVYIAQKRKITKGDKMAGRHGNKGVISNILQEADMPFKPDGNPVDIVLNPLGVPSRMNIGQILETHQGYAGTHLGLKFKNPIFQSATEREIIADLEIMTAKKLVDALIKFIKELEINVKISDRKILKAVNEAIELVTEATGEKLETVADPVNKLKKSIYDKVLDEIKGYDAYDLEILSRNLCCDPVIAESSDELEDRLLEIENLNHKKFKAENYEDSMSDEENGIDMLNDAEDKLKEIKSVSYEIPADYNYDKLLDAMEKVIIKRVGFHAKLAKTDLYDGKTGDKLNQNVCVGTIYMLKLHHLVDDKIHARATGPYSLVTQQPLGGKAQFGGQRFGEMEVWALEAYGAAHTLQEILTIKSDDVLGRVDTYESIVKGKNIPNAGIPESFKILVNELQSLCLKITVEDEKGRAIDIRTYDDTPLKG